VAERPVSVAREEKRKEARFLWGGGGTSGRRDQLTPLKGKKGEGKKPFPPLTSLGKRQWRDVPLGRVGGEKAPFVVTKGRAGHCRRIPA